MIVAKNISKSFAQGKIRALEQLSVTIPQGEFVAIAGLSGAGKSTFLRAINGTLTLDSGNLSVLGQEVTHLKGRELVDLRKQIGFIFQQFNLVRSISALQNVLTGRIGYTSRWRALTGFFSEEDRILAKEAMDSVGLQGRYHEIAKNLSGGQQQRVAIARALVQKPKIILADEPMASLDPKLSEVVLEILSRVNREQNITVIVNIHVLEYARKYARRILGLSRGKMIFDGTPSQLTEKEVEEIYKS